MEIEKTYSTHKMTRVEPQIIFCAEQAWLGDDTMFYFLLRRN
jgi:hypothetical protein